MVAQRTRTVVPGACPHDCPDTCAWQVTVENGRAVRLEGDSGHPFTRGGLCAKVNHFIERAYSSDRILYPLRRSGPKGSGAFERVSWDAALDEIAAKLQAIVATDGPTAILPYSFAGTQGLLQRNTMSDRFFARIGASRLERAICGDTAGSGLEATFGSNMGSLPEDLAHSRTIILWGTNTIVTNLHLWPFIAEARRRGATIVVIDPVKTRTAASADRHVQPLPGTDAALALSMMQVIVAEELYDRDYVAQYTLGFEELRERVSEYPPERVAMITGIEAGDIQSLARLYATNRPAAIRTLIGMEHRARGAMAYRAIACLPALVGSWRERGGGLVQFTAPLHKQAINSAALAVPVPIDPAIRTFNMIQIGQALTGEKMSPPIRALIVYNSNPAAIAPNQNLVLQGLRREDLFTVVHEQFMTDTARHADVVLPATTQLEQLDLNTSWGHTYLALNQPAIAPLGEAVPNTEMFRRLAARMGYDEPWFRQSDETLVREALNSDHPYMQGITEQRLRREGWAPLNLPDDWRPFADGNFPTPSGKCEFYAAGLIDRGQQPLPEFRPAREAPGGDRALLARYPLSLITAKYAHHFLNSSYANLPHHLRAEREPYLEMHADDAAARGIMDGDMARVYNDRGTLEVRARVGDSVRPGVAALPSGWWPSFSQGGVSANVLTADGLSDMGGGGDFHDTLVEVTRAATPTA